MLRSKWFMEVGAQPRLAMTVEVHVAVHQDCREWHRDSLQHCDQTRQLTFEEVAGSIRCDALDIHPPLAARGSARPLIREQARGARNRARIVNIDQREHSESSLAAEPSVMPRGSSYLLTRRCPRSGTWQAPS